MSKTPISGILPSPLKMNYIYTYVHLNAGCDLEEILN